MKRFLIVGVALLALGVVHNLDRLPSLSDYNSVYAAYTSAKPTIHAGTADTNLAR